MTGRNLLALLLLGLGLSACSSVHPLYFSAINSSLPPGTPQSLRFDAAQSLSLDVYRPAAASAPAPVVVFFYGGTWRDGERGFYRFVGEALARHGVLVLIPDYRKAPANPFPAFMEDAATAAAWAHAHVAEFGGDPARIHLMGHSAGAHMVALLGTDPRYLARRGLQPRDFASVIGLSGPYDFLPIKEAKIKGVFADKALWPDSQPINFVDGDEPPFLLLHGKSDRRVWESNSIGLAARLRAAGVPVTLHVVPKTGHIAMVNGFLSPRFSPALEETLAWINGGRASALASASGEKNATPPAPATPHQE